MNAQEIEQLCTPEYVDQILKFAALMPMWRNFGGTWLRKCEKEHMVWSTIRACAMNYEEHRIPCSIRGDSVFQDCHNGLVENRESYRAILDDGYLIESECPEKMQANHAGGVVLFPTQKLLDALAVHFSDAVSRY